MNKYHEDHHDGDGEGEGDGDGDGDGANLCCISNQAWLTQLIAPGVQHEPE